MGGYNNNFKSGGYGNRNNGSRPGGNSGGRSGNTNDKYRWNHQLSFVNPYNFVPTVAPKRDVNAEETTGARHTGYFSCRLITRTPLAIPDVAEQGEDGAYPFMTISGSKVIPGSSIRGVIRNIYEAATNSCMITVSDDDVITARADSRKAFKPGILIRDVKGEWTLYSAKRVPLIIKDALHKPMGGDYTSFANENPYINEALRVPEWKGAIKINGVTYHWGDPVWVDDSGKKHVKTFNNGKSFPAWDCSANDIRPVRDGETNRPGYQKGYLYLGEAISNKHAESVFIQGQPVPVKGQAPDYIDRLDKIYEAYNDDAVNRNLKVKPDDRQSKPHYGYQGYQTAKRNGVIPIWYEQTPEGRIHVSFAAIGRMAYDHSLSDISNVGRTCKDRINVCKACALFGMVGDKSLGSKIRITDAACVSDPGTMENVLLKELGSPKPSYLPFYTEKGMNYDQQGIQIRGRKFYWHNPKAASDCKIYSGDPNGDTSRSSVMEVQRPNAEYTFRVYYDGITDEQLNGLAWAITLGDNDTQADHCIKIGHGKPLGLGSAKVVIDSAIERIIDIDKGTYSSTEIAVDSRIHAGMRGVESNVGYKELMEITSYSAVQHLSVEYPYVDNTKDPSDRTGRNNPNLVASHQWFGENKKQGGKGQPGYLPHITEPQELHPIHYNVSMADGGRHNQSQERVNSHQSVHQNDSRPNVFASAWNSAQQPMPPVAQPTDGTEIVRAVERINAKGNYMLGRDDQGSHMLYARAVPERVSLQEGDKVHVILDHKNTYDDGNTTYFYRFVRKE